LSTYTKAFSLIEVLIALFVLSVGTLSFLGLQLFAIQNTRRAYDQSVATVQVNNMLDRLRANNPKAWQRELHLWNSENSYLLPHGEGSYSCVKGSLPECTVTLNWNGGVKEKLSITSIVQS